MSHANLQLFWNTYNARRDLDFNGPRTGRNAKTLCCLKMLVVGDNEPAEDGTVESSCKLDSTTTTFLKGADSRGLPTITHPGKLSEAFKYFLPGVGSMPSASRTRLACPCTVSLTSASSAEGSHSPTGLHPLRLGLLSHSMELPVEGLGPARCPPALPSSTSHCHPHASLFCL